jgi:hypothetical protein
LSAHSSGSNLLDGEPEAAMATTEAIRRSSRAPRLPLKSWWSALCSIGARLNGSALPLELHAGDRAELQRTIDG